MKGQRVGREIKRVGNVAGGHPVGARLDQQPEDIETVVLRKGGESNHSIMFFHNSTNIELFRKKQAIYFARGIYLFYCSTTIELGAFDHFSAMGR